MSLPLRLRIPPPDTEPLAWFHGASPKRLAEDGGGYPVDLCYNRPMKALDEVLGVLQVQGRFIK